MKYITLHGLKKQLYSTTYNCHHIISLWRHVKTRSIIQVTLSSKNIRTCGFTISTTASCKRNFYITSFVILLSTFSLWSISADDGRDVRRGGTQSGMFLTDSSSSFCPCINFVFLARADSIADLALPTPVDVKL